MFKRFQKLSPPRIIALGFALLILLGSILLYLPCSVKEGVDLHYIDALYTSTSAVCVTGLIAVDAGDTFTPLGQFFLALLIQIGGLGLTAVGAGIILAMRKKMNIKGRTLIKEALNLDTGRGLMSFVRDIFITTMIFELLGACFSFLVFIRDFPLGKAIGLSLFHSVAAFNNSGFDILGNYQNLTAYQNDILLNIVTAVLIFFGGIGFLVIRELWTSKCRWKLLSMHSKVVLSVSAILILVGTLLLKMTEDITWLGAFFHSVSARTAGFSSYPIGSFSNAGLFAVIILMFIGASPGSTGGGIKTSTFFVLIQGIKSAATNKSEKAFRYAIPKKAFKKASVITILALSIVMTATYLLLCIEPDITFMDALFEMTSAFGTVGLSTGITPDLCPAAKILSMLIMYTGRIGPLTVITLWHFTDGENVKYPDGNLAIG